MKKLISVFLIFSLIILVEPIYGTMSEGDPGRPHSMTNL